jgi:hypothetical protein
MHWLPGAWITGELLGQHPVSGSEPLIEFVQEGAA